MTQPLMDAADAAIVLCFAAATLALVVYVWRRERRHDEHHSTRT